MKRFGRIIAVFTLAVGLAACQSNVIRAKILDVRLNIEVTHLTLRHPTAQQKTQRPQTSLDVGLVIANPSDQRVWANDCRGQAFDDSGGPLYTFSFNPGVPAGLELEGNASWTGSVVAAAQVPPDIAASGVRATAACQAWDWGDHPPI